MVTPGRGLSVSPGWPNMADLKPKSMKSWVWSARCGEPVPMATPAVDTWPLWPGGSTDSA